MRKSNNKVEGNSGEEVNENVLKNLTEEELLKMYTKDQNGATLLNGKIVRIPATRDYMFKNLFGVNGKEENLRLFLQAILKIKIKSVEIQNPELPRDNIKDKNGVLDVRAKLNNGTTIFIEMQVKDEHNIGERLTYYICTLYSKSIEIGGMYNKIEKNVAIAIINFSYFNRKEYHQIAHIKFEECKNPEEIVEADLEEGISETVTDKFEVHLIDLERFRKLKEPKGELADWLTLIMGDERGIYMASKRNKEIKRINKENKKLSLDKEMQEKYWYELKETLAENTRISVATEKGIEIGKTEGIKIGKFKRDKEIAKKLKQKNMSIDEIMEITGLSKEEIEEL